MGRNSRSPVRWGNENGNNRIWYLFDRDLNHLSQSRLVYCKIPVWANISTGICYSRPPSTEINWWSSNNRCRYKVIEYIFCTPGTKINGSPVANGDHFCSLAPETFLLTRPCGDWKLSVVSRVQIQSQRRKVNLWRVLQKLKDTFCN